MHVAAVLKQNLDDSADFCKMNPPACEGNLGITRNNMPQIMDKPISNLLDSMPEGEYDDLLKKVEAAGDKSLKEVITDKDQRDNFIDRRKGLAAIEAGAKPGDTPQKMWFDALAESGVEVTEDEIEVGKLIASQAEIKAGKSYGIAQAYLTDKFKKLPDLPILVARDPKTGDVTVIDGHHRYAGLLLADPSKKMKVKVIETGIQDALDKSFDVPGVFRADLQDNIVDSNSPLDLARKPGDTWKQRNGKFYAKNSKGETGGPYETDEAAKNYASGKGGKKASRVPRPGEKFTALSSYLDITGMGQYNQEMVLEFIVNEDGSASILHRGKPSRNPGSQLSRKRVQDLFRHGGGAGLGGMNYSLSQPKIFRASDRKNLARLASTLPVGDPLRRAILAGCRKAGKGKVPDALKKHQFKPGEGKGEDADGDGKTNEKKPDFLKKLKKKSRANRKKIERHMYVIHKAGDRYVVTQGDPRKPGVKIRMRSPHKSDVTEYLEEIGVSNDHTFDMTHEFGIPDTYSDFYMSMGRLASSARPSLIRLAASLPKGSPERRRLITMAKGN
jgi:hypothetical protein